MSDDSTHRFLALRSVRRLHVHFQDKIRKGRLESFIALPRLHQQFFFPVYEFLCSLFALVSNHVSVPTLKKQPRLSFTELILWSHWTALVLNALKEESSVLFVSSGLCLLWGSELLHYRNIQLHAAKSVLIQCLNQQLFTDRPPASSSDILHHLMVY